jgi:hypothetical protein
MKRSLFVSCLLGLAPVFGASTKPFDFDRPLAIQLAISYVQAFFHEWPKAALPDVDYQHPDVVAVTDKQKRKLIFVSFASTKPGVSAGWGHWGAMVSFQLCKEPPLLRVVDVGTTDPIEAERAEDAKIDADTQVEQLDVCPPLP